MVEKGLTNREIAMRLKIDEATIYNWKKQHVEFFESLKCWKEFADSEVETSLYQRAKGYKLKEVKVLQDSRGNIIEHETIRHLPPDPTSCIFWLKNRKPAEWREKQEIEHSVSEIKIDKQDEAL